MEKKFVMDVSKKENGEYVKQGSVEVRYPMLTELDIPIESTGVDEDGFPTFENEKHQYVFDAVLAAVKANARNKLISGTATLKDGAKIPETIEELLAAGDRSGAALANRREAFKALVAFVPQTGKSAAVQQWVAEQCKNLSGIPFQSEARRNLLVDIIGKFAETLTAEQASKFGRALTAVDEACKTVAGLEDLPE